MANSGTQTTTLADAKGRTARVTWWETYTTLADASTIATNVDAAVEAMSNAAPLRSGGVAGLYDVPFAYGAAATFQNAEDKAVLTFQDADGGLHRFSIPAPKAAIFLADAETVDPANALVIALVTAVTTTVTASYVSSRDQVKITSFVGGFRARRRMQRRLNIRIKNPAETGPAE